MNTGEMKKDIVSCTKNNAQGVVKVLAQAVGSGALTAGTGALTSFVGSRVLDFSSHTTAGVIGAAALGTGIHCATIALSNPLPTQGFFANSSNSATSNNPVRAEATFATNYARTHILGCIIGWAILFSTNETDTTLGNNLEATTLGVLILLAIHVVYLLSHHCRHRMRHPHPTEQPTPSVITPAPQDPILNTSAPAPSVTISINPLPSPTPSPAKF